MFNGSMMDRFLSFWLKNFYSVVYSIFQHPFKLHWDEFGLQMTLSRKDHSHSDKLGRHFLICRCNYFYSIFHFLLCFLMFLLHVGTYVREKDYTKLATHGYWLGLATAIVVCQTPYYLRTNEVLQLINGNVALIKHLEEESNFGKGAFSNICKARRRFQGWFSMYGMAKWIFSGVPFCIHNQPIGTWLMGSHLVNLSKWLGASAEVQMVVSIIGVTLDSYLFFGVFGAVIIGLHINMTFMHTFKTSVLRILR